MDSMQSGLSREQVFFGLVLIRFLMCPVVRVKPWKTKPWGPDAKSVATDANRSKSVRNKAIRQLQCRATAVTSLLNALLQNHSATVCCSY